jgi:hypothetical protein
LVVFGLRVRFIEGGELMPWEWTRTRVDPQADDVQDVTAPLSIPGRDTRELVAEFVGSYPGVVPEQRAYPVAVDARSSVSEDWQEVLKFDLQLGNLIHPSNYIVCTNQHDYLSERELEEGAQNLAKLRRQWGLEPTPMPTPTLTPNAVAERGDSCGGMTQAVRSASTGRS